MYFGNVKERMAGDVEEQNCVGERERKPQKETEDYRQW